MNDIKIITFDTIQKEIRSKTLLWLFVLNILFILIVTGGINYVSSLVADMGVPMDMKNKSIFIISFFISFWSGILGIIFGGNCIRSDEDEGVLNQFLSLPISRFEYLAGRAIGALSISFSFFLILNIFALLIVTISGDDFPFLAATPLGILVSLFSLLGLILISMLISMHSGKIISFITTMFIYFFLTFSESIFYRVEFSEMFKELNLFRGVALLFYSILPHISTLGNVSRKLMIGSDYEGINYMYEFFHYSLTLGLLIFVMHLIFSKKEI